MLQSPTISVAFLVNPASGNGSAGKRWPKLQVLARHLGLDGDVFLSERPGQLTELARAVASTHDLVVAVGGDGTVNEVVNGIAETGAELAVLPSGTGQDFGRTHEIPSKPDDAIRAIIDGETKTLDLGRVRFESGER